MTKPEKLLAVSNLQTCFRLADGAIARAVDRISFTVDAGETVALVGESGCGKSVTAFSIMRLLPDNAFHPTGEITFAGENLLGKSETEMESLRGDRIAMIFQEPMTSLNPVMRIGRQLMEPLLIHRGLTEDAAAREAVALLGRVGIPAAAERVRDYPHQLSGGMKQRVMIAMALACRPQPLVADAPTTALDVTIQAQILRLMKDLQAETGMAMLFITHDLGIVNQIADKVCVMYAGQIVEQGTREEVFRNLAHPYTRALFQALPQGRARQRRLYSIPGSVPPATALPSGCHFHERCPYRFERCDGEESRAHPVAPPHGTVPPPGAQSGSVPHTAACHWFENGRCLDDAPVPETARETPVAERAGGVGLGEVLLEVHDLQAHFPVKRGLLGRVQTVARAVDGVSLTLPRGTTLALVGESGCGKTTVGLSLLRLLREAQGRIVFQGQDMETWSRRELRAMRRRLQIVFQDPFSSLSPRLTVEAIVAEGLTVHVPDQAAAARRQRVVRALEEVGLDEAALPRYPHEFSGGQRQRISLARALVLEPDFLVLDEPTSALDVSVQAQILNLLIGLQAAHGFTYLIITHNLGVVEYLADRVAVMYLGRIVEEAACEELFAQPRHPYTRSLLASIPSVTARQELARLEGEVPSPVAPPAGCHFHPRCPMYGTAGPGDRLRALCPVHYPALLAHGDRRAACHALEPDDKNRRADGAG